MRDELSDRYATFEERHWWSRGRRAILKSLLARHLTIGEGASVLEVGVGSGVNLYSIYPEGLRLFGLEPHAGNASIARERGSVPVYTGTVESLPAELADRSFEAISLFDVLEHIEDDQAAIGKLRELLTPRGLLVLSVPAYQWMWGRQDLANEHYRRYTLGGLERLLEESGFAVVRGTYFNSVLFAPIALKRLMSRLLDSQGSATGSDFDVRVGVMDRLLGALFSAERFALRVTNFPFGVSAFVVAKRS